MPRIKTSTTPPRFFITIEVEEEVKVKVESRRKELGFKRISDYGRKLFKEDLRQQRAG